MTQKKALVFGANGCIGTHLVKYLQERNYWVRCILSMSSQKVLNPSSHYMHGDITDIAFVNQCFILEDDSCFDEVYQLAADMGGASYNNTGLFDADIMSNSALMNINVVKCVVKYKAKKLFFPSSACVYPVDKKNNAECFEDDAYPANPEYGYGWEKLFTEKMLYSFSKQYGIEVRIARLHSVVGEHAKWYGGREKAHSALARKVAEVKNGGTIEVIGDGTQKRTFLYVKDCVDGIYKLMCSDCMVPINIGSDVSVSINEYIDILRVISKKEFNVKYVLGSIGVQERYCHIDKAKHLIHWEPTTSLIESTKRTYAWIEGELVKQSQN